MIHRLGAVSCVALMLLAPALAPASTKICQDNWVYISFFDEGGKPLSLNTATASFDGFNATAGQSCGEHMIEAANWCTDHESGSTCKNRASSPGPNVLAAYYNTGRSKSTDMGTQFRAETNNNPLFGLGLSQDQTEGSYSPDELNLWIGIDLNNIDIGSGRFLSIPSIKLAQGSETSGIKAIYDVIRDAAETVFWAYADELEESLKSFAKLVGASMDLKFENNWYASQQGANVYMTTYKNKPGLVLHGQDQHGQTYPIIIQDGGGDYHFIAYVITGTATSASKTLAGMSHVGKNHFFHPSIGLFEYKTDSGLEHDWVYSLQLGPLYLLDLPNPSGQSLRWMYSLDSASWILWNPKVPGVIYHYLTNTIYQYDYQTMRFVRDPKLDLWSLLL